MGIKVLEVLFTGNTCVYTPGDLVTGEVQIVCDKKEDVRCIQLNFVGQSYTHWTETEGSGEHRNTYHCTTDYYYFNEEVIVRGNANSKADRITLDGEHRFPFKFQIPNTSLPPPFEGFYGYVRYYIKITVDRPWKLNQHTEKFFSILTVKDLNKEPNVLVPLSHQVEKTVCCLCCASGPIVLKGLIDKRGYVPGEYIFVSVDLHNNSSRTINHITLTLQQMSFYTAYSSRGTCYKDYINKVAEVKLDGCEAMGSMNYDRIKMLVPPVPPCAHENCPNIQIKYLVEIEAGISGTPMNAKVHHPIVIGTIPAFQRTLKTSSQDRRPDIPRVQAPPAAGGTPQSGFPTPSGHVYPPSGQQGYPPPEQLVNPLPGQPEYPPSGQPELPGPGPSQMVRESDRTGGSPPPPTYETAVGGPHEMERTEGSFCSVSYAPQYPYYDPDTLYAAMGIPQGASGSTAAGEHPLPPTTSQPVSIHQPPSYNF